MYGYYSSDCLNQSKNLCLVFTEIDLTDLRFIHYYFKYLMTDHRYYATTQPLTLLFTAWSLDFETELCLHKIAHRRAWRRGTRLRSVSRLPA
jgi:hypothetical protein